jgi:lysozyme family protein
MNALDTRKDIQRILGVKQDGDFGPKTHGMFERLGVTPGGQQWPPVSEPQPTPGQQRFDGFSPNLREEYQQLWDTMTARWEDDHTDEPGLEAIYEGLQAELEGVLRAIRENKGRYEKISQMTGGKIPWDFIAVIHNLECGLNFKKHLHNGDPLTARTVLVPRGRPATGSPPFSFEDSAVDALTMPGKAYHLEDDWSIPAILYRLEGFNGYGYRKYHPDVNSPYLWSGSGHYTRGKYVADSQWSSSAVSKQLGSALVLKALREPAPATV